MKRKSEWSKWLGILALKHKLGDDDPDIAIVEAWVKRDLTKQPPTDEELAAVVRINEKMMAKH